MLLVLLNLLKDQLVVCMLQFSLSLLRVLGGNYETMGTLRMMCGVYEFGGLRKRSVNKLTICHIDC